MKLGRLIISLMLLASCVKAQQVEPFTFDISGMIPKAYVGFPVLEFSASKSNFIKLKYAKYYTGRMPKASDFKVRAIGIERAESDAPGYIPTIESEIKLSEGYVASFIGDYLLVGQTREITLPMIMCEDISRQSIIETRKHDLNPLMSKKCNLLLAMLLSKKGKAIYSCDVKIPSEKCLKRNPILDPEDFTDEKIEELKIDILLTRMILDELVQSSYYLKGKGY